MKDLYEILNLKKNASQAEIKAAYRSLSKKYHPDLNSSSDATKKMQELNQAYAVLSDPIKRAEYDQLQELEKDSPSAEGIFSKHNDNGPHYCCEKCGRQDSTLRVTIFTWVVGLLVSAHKRGWAKILCKSCRNKYSVIFNLQVSLMGWWCFPWGPLWAIQAFYQNAMGGIQPAENNAILLASLGIEFSKKGKLEEARKAFEQSLRFKNNPDVVQMLKQVEAKLKGERERPSNFWIELFSWGLHPFAYSAILVCALYVSFVLLGMLFNEPPKRAILAGQMSNADIEALALKIVAQNGSLKKEDPEAYEQEIHKEALDASYDPVKETTNDKLNGHDSSEFNFEVYDARHFWGIAPKPSSAKRMWNSFCDFFENSDELYKSTNQSDRKSYFLGLVYEAYSKYPEEMKKKERPVSSRITSSTERLSTSSLATQPNKTDILFSFVQAFVQSGNHNSNDNQLNYYDENVSYFNQGIVDKNYIAQDLINYHKQWPYRQYSLLSWGIAPQGTSENIKVILQIAFQTFDGQKTRQGKVEDTLLIQFKNGRLFIVAIASRFIQ